MTLNQIIEAYKAGAAVSEAELSTLTGEEKREFVNQLLVDEELFLKAVPECFINNPTISAEVKTISNWWEKYSNIILKNNEIFKKLIFNSSNLNTACNLFPEKKIALITKYSFLNESIEEIVDRISEKFDQISEKSEYFNPFFLSSCGLNLEGLNKFMEEKCSLLSALNEKLKDLYHQPAKSQAEKDQLKKIRDQIIDLEESFPQLTDSNEWQTEKAKFLDFFNWRCSSLVNATVAFLREKYPATTLTVIEKDMVPTDLRQKLEAPTVNQTFRA